MDKPALYLHASFIAISLPNLIVILLLIVVFILAVALRLPDKQHYTTLESIPRTDTEK